MKAASVTTKAMSHGLASGAAGAAAVGATSTALIAT